MTQPVTPELDAELTDDERRELDAKRLPPARDYPKPTQGDIEGLYKQLEPLFTPLYRRIADERDVRYMRDETPAKWRRFLKDGRRFHSRISHNEVMRIAAMLGRNPPVVTIPAAGDRQTDITRATKQTRWANNLIPALERQAGGQRVLRPLLDNIAGDGLGVIEVYMKDHTVYDDIDAEAQQVWDDALQQYRDETPREVNKRLDEQLASAPLPFGWRRVSPLSYMAERLDGVTTRALVVEYKPYRAVYERLVKRRGGDDLHLPRPGTAGWAPPVSATGSWYSNRLRNVGESVSDATNSVVTIRYYDQRYYAYIVGGVLVDGPVEHKMPGVPLIEIPGMLTGSDDIAEAYQGVTTGMVDMERAINDMYTLGLDAAYVFSRPRPIATAPSGVTIPAGQLPPAIDLSGDRMEYLIPGYDVKDAFAGFEPRMADAMIGQLMNMFQRSGLNPIAAGESPGSDVAGYTVNTLTQSAQSLYEIILENLSIGLGQMIDFIRLMIRDTIRERVGLSTMRGGKHGETEWLQLGPDDIDETPSEVSIDPLAEANRMALVAQKAQLNKQGYMPRREVQLAAGADDPEMWDDELVLDAADEQQMQKAIEMADAIIDQQAVQRGIMPPQTQPPQGQNPGQPGTPPAPTGGAPGAPSVGAGNAAASQPPFETQPGPARIAPATQRAGQARP